jgi:GNAT superfamily N-acetyltransferase
MRSDERDVVASLLHASYGVFADDVPTDLLRGWLDDVVDPGAGVTLVAHADGRLVGTARLHPPGTYPVPLPAGVAGVRAVAVDQRARRTGIATALMAECAARAQEAGGSALYLHTASFMPAATALYARLGYRRGPAWDFDAGAHFGLGQRFAVVATAFRLNLRPTCRVVRPGDTYEGRQTSTSRQVYPPADQHRRRAALRRHRPDRPNEQESVVPMPELDGAPDTRRATW